MSTHLSIPKGYVDNLTTKRPQLALMYGTSLSGGRSLSSWKHLPPLTHILHGRPHQTYNAIMHGSGIGGDNTTRIVERTARQRRMLSRDNSGSIPKRPVQLNPGNSSYASRIAHSLLIDTNSRLSPYGAATNPVGYAQVRQQSDSVRRALSGSIGRQRARRGRPIPVQRKWYMDSTHYATT